MNFSHKGIQNRKHQLESAATHRLHKLQLIGIRLTLIGLIFVSLFAEKALELLMWGDYIAWVLL